MTTLMSLKSFNITFALSSLMSSSSLLEQTQNLPNNTDTCYTISESDWAECSISEHLTDDAIVEVESMFCKHPLSIEGYTYSSKTESYVKTAFAPTSTPNSSVVTDPTTLTTSPLNLLFRTIRKCHYFAPSPVKDLDFDIGDIIRVLARPTEAWNEAVEDGFGIHYVWGENLRTERVGRVHWHCFRAVGKREICPCWRQNCVCVYEDYVVSLVSCL